MELEFKKTVEILTKKEETIKKLNEKNNIIENRLNIIKNIAQYIKYYQKLKFQNRSVDEVTTISFPVLR